MHDRHRLECDIHHPECKKIVKHPECRKSYTQGLECDDSTAVAMTHSTLVLIHDNKQISDLPVSYGPLHTSMHPSKPEVAIGAKVGFYFYL